ncbi:Prefoldin subunit 3, partial [Chiua virens]
MDSTLILGQEKNPRGIPKAPFIANVKEYIGSPDGDVEGPLRIFQDAIAKYRYMDASLTQRRRSLEDKIPDIKKTLYMVEYLQERREGKQKSDDDTDELDDDDSEGEDSEKPLSTTFELNDTLYAEAQLEDTDTVHLWLGANVMLSYKLPAAISLLQSKLRAIYGSFALKVLWHLFIRQCLAQQDVTSAFLAGWAVERVSPRRHVLVLETHCIVYQRMIQTA